MTERRGGFMHLLNDVGGPQADSGSARDDSESVGTTRYVLSMLRSLAPSIGLSIVATVAVYLALRPLFPASSTGPLIGALVCPLMANVVSLARRRRLDVFGVLVIVGLVWTVVAAALGGGQRVLLMRETFLTGALGVVLLASLPFARPVGYYFARHLLTGGGPAREPHFAWLWSLPRFRRYVRLVTAVWGCLSVCELALQATLVLTLPVVAVLSLTVVVVELPRFGGLVVSLVATRRVVADIRATTTDGSRPPINVPT